MFDYFNVSHMILVIRNCQQEDFPREGLLFSVCYSAMLSRVLLLHWRRETLSTLPAWIHL